MDVKLMMMNDDDDGLGDSGDCMIQFYIQTKA